MFDVFMTHSDGRAQHLMSVRCLAQAQEMARELSCLVPGEYFGYFEHTEDDITFVSQSEGLITGCRTKNVFQ
jgi:hypothetical protein